MTSQTEPVRREVRDHVALLTLCNPKRRNALTEQSSAALRDAVRACEADPDVHALIVTGEGTAFCAGADLSALGVATDEGLLRLYDGFLAVAESTLPTIAAVNGPAVGAGLNLALACDVRIAGPAAMFDARFQRLGIHPGGGMTWLIHRAVGPETARAAVLFGKRFDAAEAVAHGVAFSVADDPVSAARELAAGPAAAPRELVLATKATMRATANPGAVDTDSHRAALRTELTPQADSIASHPTLGTTTTGGSRQVAANGVDGPATR
jgi:enoyl-CoA hydratase